MFRLVSSRLLKSCLTGGAELFPILLGLSYGLARLTSLALGRLLVVAVTFHIPRQPFALAKALKSLQHLLNGFVPARPDFDQLDSDPAQYVSNRPRNSRDTSRTKRTGPVRSRILRYVIDRDQYLAFCQAREKIANLSRSVL